MGGAIFLGQQGRGQLQGSSVPDRDWTEQLWVAAEHIGAHQTDGQVIRCRPKEATCRRGIQVSPTTADGNRIGSRVRHGTPQASYTLRIQQALARSGLESQVGMWA